MVNNFPRLRSLKLQISVSEPIRIHFRVNRRRKDQLSADFNLYRLDDVLEERETPDEALPVTVSLKRKGIFEQ
jgi:hypothetical protein